MRHPQSRLGGFVSALALIFLLSTPVHAALTPNGKLQIVHMDVGQGDGALIMSPLGEVFMVDDGLFNSPARVVTEVHTNLAISHVKLHFASHLHADHIGTISQLQASGVTFDAGWDRGGSYSSATYTTYNTTLGPKRHTLTKGQIFTLDSLSAHPVIIKCVDLKGAGISLDTTNAPENSRSVVLKVTYGEFDEELGGDLTGFLNGAEKDIETTIATEVGRVEVYKAHHHASKYGSNNTYLDSLHAKVAIVSCGTGNTFGHPTSEAIGRMHNHGLRTFWTETGSGVSPQAGVDKVANGRITIQAVWQAGGVDSIYFGSDSTIALADTFTNSGGSAVDLIAPTVTLNAPNGGESWAPGTQHAVTWTASDNVGVFSVDVNYSVDNGSNWIPVAAGLNNLGSYNWTVPATPSNQTLVQVVARDVATNAGTDQSNAAFTIPDLIAPTAVVGSPNGGEFFTSGNSTTVRWTSADNVTVDSVNVDYSVHGSGGPWLAIGHGLAPNDSLIWVLPGDSSDSALVRVTAYDHALNTAFDLSDSLFHLVPAVVGSGAGPGPHAGTGPTDAQPEHGQGAGRCIHLFDRALQGQLAVHMHRDAAPRGRIDAAFHAHHVAEMQHLFTGGNTVTRDARIAVEEVFPAIDEDAAKLLHHPEAGDAGTADAAARIGCLRRGVSYPEKKNQQHDKQSCHAKTTFRKGAHDLRSRFILLRRTASAVTRLLSS